MTNGNDSIHNSEQGPYDGLTKREYFAAMAMQGFLASYSGYTTNPKPEAVGEWSLYYADALINALNNEE